jgi:hypothetical protein
LETRVGFCGASLRYACKPKGSPTGVCHDFYIIFAIDFLFTSTINTKHPLKTP